MGYQYNDGLRYSLVPLVIVFVSSITKYNDSKRKCLDEYGIKGKRWRFKMWRDYHNVNSLSHTKSMASVGK